MTNKVTMPEPVATARRTPSAITYKHKTSLGLKIGENYLITTTQAEAYADARVREALEGLAKIARDRYEIALSSRHNCDDGECPDTWEATAVAMAYSYQTMETHIRALIPTTK